MVLRKFFSIKFVLLWALVICRLDGIWGDEPGARCGGGDPCIYMDKDIGWIRWRKPEWEHKPFPPKSDSWKRPDATIYLTIASFRDKLCPLTLYNLFSKARHPERIFPGVVQQNVPGTDMDCLDTYCMLVEDFGLRNFSASVMDSVLTEKSAYRPTGPSPRKRHSSFKCPFEGNVRMDRVDARTAQGPTWARARGSLMLHDGDEFCMQTDAHMDFVLDWDVKMLETWAATNNEYAILSTYVAPTEQLKFNEGDSPKGLNGLHEVPHLCMVTLFGSHELPRIWGTKCARSLPEPKLTNGIWGAGLSFSKCHAERKAPYDPHTPQIFDGEEFSRSIRFWTWGYDIYTPHRVYVVHNYHLSQSDPTHFDWARNAVGAGELSAVRIKTLIAAPGGMDATNPAAAEAMRKSKYGLGDRRTLEQYITFSGIDTRARKILGNRCGNLDWVPFRENPLGVDYIPSFSQDSKEASLDPPDPNSIYFGKQSGTESVELAAAKAKWDAFANTKLAASGSGSASASALALAVSDTAAVSAAVSEAAFGATVRRLPPAVKAGSIVATSKKTMRGQQARGSEESSSSSASAALLIASSNLSSSDALLLGVTLVGMLGLGLYALLCRKHFSNTLLVSKAGRDKQDV